MKKIALAVLAVGAVFANGSAFAAPISCAATSGQAWSFFDTLSSEGCFDSDKVYTNFSISGTSNTGTLTGTIDHSSFGGYDYHSVKWSNGTNVNGLNFTVSYDVTVTDPIKWIAQVTLGADIPVAGAQATANINGGVGAMGPVSFGSGLNNIKYTAGQPTTLHVQHTINASAGGYSSSTLTYVQANPNSGVPEIDALAGTGALTLLGGALALAGERRRRRA